MRTKAATKLLQVGAEMSKALGSERFEWQTMQIFLTLCTHGGEMPQAEIEKVTGWAQSAVSRNVAKLGQGLSVAERGAGLVEAYEDPMWRRRKLVKITPRGRQLADRLGDIID